jgi:uncharacterized repeat protein (TIGR01451 family)
LTGTIGETIFYKMIVRDTGNTTLNVTLRDPICDSGTIIPRLLHPVTPVLTSACMS